MGKGLASKKAHPKIKMTPLLDSWDGIVLVGMMCFLHLVKLHCMLLLVSLHSFHFTTLLFLFRWTFWTCSIRRGRLLDCSPSDEEIKCEGDDEKGRKKHRNRVRVVRLRFPLLVTCIRDEMASAPVRLTLSWITFHFVFFFVFVSYIRWIPFIFLPSSCSSHQRRRITVLPNHFLMCLAVLCLRFL